MAITQGVHAQPEFMMVIRSELGIASQRGQAVNLKGYRIVLDVVQHVMAHDKKTAVDPSNIANVLFSKANHPVAATFNGAKAHWRPNCGDGCQSPGLIVTIQEGIDVD